MFRFKGEGEDQVDQCFDRIDRLYLKNPASSKDGLTLTPTSAHVLPLAWEDENMATIDREFPSDHGAVVIDLEWTNTTAK
jgi:hypothetical protein